MKIDWKTVGENVLGFAGYAFGFALAISPLLPSRKSNSSLTNHYGYVTASYGKAIKAILESDMLDCYKSDAIDVLRKDGDVEYYEAVIAIVNSDMLDCYKSDMIEKISEDF